MKEQTIYYDDVPSFYDDTIEVFYGIFAHTKLFQTLSLAFPCHPFPPPPPFSSERRRGVDFFATQEIFYFV